MKMTVKKIVSIVMSFLMIFIFTACSSQKGEGSDVTSVISDTTKADNGNTEAKDSSPDTSDTSNNDNDKKVLVVYFSATGNTKEVAEHISAATGGDMFELVPAEPYSSGDLSWTDKNSRVVYEHDHPDERNIELTKVTVDNFEEYDTVFIGYPIWWGIAAWPVNGFVSSNDFTGKTVIPFCTSSSSGIGDSGELLKEAATGGNWLEGKRFSSSASEAEVNEWVQDLGM